MYILALALTILAILAIATLMYLYMQSEQSGGSLPPFSNIGDYIGKDVAGSYDGRRAGPRTRVVGADVEVDANTIRTYYGHSVPLVHEDRPPGPLYGQRLSNLGKVCAPECCPSIHSCDHGCVCVT